jgi:hypothetical protein
MAAQIASHTTSSEKSVRHTNGLWVFGMYLIGLTTRCSGLISALYRLIKEIKIGGGAGGGGSGGGNEIEQPQQARLNELFSPARTKDPQPL